MADFILREEENRFQVYVESKQQTHNIGCEPTEEEARFRWLKAKFVLDGAMPKASEVDLYQSRTCSGDKPFLLKKGTKLD